LFKLFVFVIIKKGYIVGARVVHTIPLGFDDNKSINNNWNTNICSSVQNQRMNLSLKDEHMKSIIRTKRSL